MDDKVPRNRCREKRSILFVALIVFSVTILAIVIVLVKLHDFYSGDVCLTDKCAEASVFFLDNIDSSSDPCENFYNFSCGGYEGSSTLKNAQLSINKIIKTYITSPIHQKDSRSIKLQKKYYKACMNVKLIEDDQNRSLKKLFDELGGWPILTRNWNESQFDVGLIIETCIDNGLYYDWYLYVENEPSYNQSNENLHIKPPDNVNKITEDLKQSYILLIANIVDILGSKETLTPLSDMLLEIVQFENEMYEIIQSSKKQNQEELCTVDTLKRDFPYIPWSSILKNVIWANNTKIICSTQNYLSKFGKFLNKTSKRTQANYIFWKITDSLQTFLSNDIRRQFKSFEEQRGNAVGKERSEFCYGVTSTVFAYVSEAEYARRHAVRREPVAQIIRNIEIALQNHIENSKWMNETHKRYAVWKLKSMKYVIGAPNEMFDEKKFDSLLGLDEIDILHLNNTLDIIRAVDRSRDVYNLNLIRPKISIKRIQFYHGVSSLQTIKYLPDENLMFLPAAAFTAPIYSECRPEYINYGALGTIIGHELVHGFGVLDSVEYHNGNKRINWSNATFTDFFDAAECLLNHCNEIGDNKSINISCQNTLEENLADYTGINLAYEAYARLHEMGENRLPGLPYNSYQLFWISYASTLCYNSGVNSTDHFTHMLPYQRIMGSFRNSEYFAKDFSCPLGSNMNPEKKCKVL